MGFAKAEKWYNQRPEGLKSESHKVLWDFNIQCNKKIDAKTINVVAILGDAWVAEKN